MAFRGFCIWTLHVHNAKVHIVEEAATDELGEKLRQRHFSDLGAPEEYNVIITDQHGKKKDWMPFKTSWNFVNLDHGAIPNSCVS